jgi:uncharacterized protein Veg
MTDKEKIEKIKTEVKAHIDTRVNDTSALTLEKKKKIK